MEALGEPSYSSSSQRDSGTTSPGATAVREREQISTRITHPSTAPSPAQPQDQIEEAFSAEILRRVSNGPPVLRTPDQSALTYLRRWEK